MIITDCHVHIEPYWMMNPTAAAMMHKKRPNFAEIVGYSQDPNKFLSYLDGAGGDHTDLLLFDAPETLGFTMEVNEWVVKYCATDPERLLPCAGIHPKFANDVEAEMNKLIGMGVRLFKVHPPHQLLYPNDYLNGNKGLE